MLELLFALFPDLSVAFAESYVCKLTHTSFCLNLISQLYVKYTSLMKYQSFNAFGEAAQWCLSPVAFSMILSSNFSCYKTDSTSETKSSFIGQDIILHKPAALHCRRDVKTSNNGIVKLIIVMMHMLINGFQVKFH